MDIEKITKTHQALKYLNEEALKTSESVSSKLEGLSQDEQTQLAKDAVASTIALAKEVVAHSQDGNIDLGDAGKYYVEVYDMGGTRVTVGRIEHSYTPEGNESGFGDLLHIDSGRHMYPFEALDAQETMQAIHTAVVPKES